MKVLVIGGAGYIGSHMVKALVEAGHATIVFDSLVTGHREAVHPAAAHKRPAVEIYGDDYDTPDGTCIRDYIHVTDLAEAHVLALRALEGGARTTAYNLGNGRGFSVKEVTDAARVITGREIAVRTGPRRAGDPPRLVGDTTMIKQVLGWKPRHADLEDMIGTAWKWHQQVNSEQ